MSPSRHVRLGPPAEPCFIGADDPAGAAGHTVESRGRGPASGMKGGGRWPSRFCHRATFFLVWPVVLLAGACRDAPSDEQQTWRVSSDPSVEIGRATGNEAYLFASIRSAHLLEDGSIVVADDEQLEIRVYGSDGVIRSEFGGEGAGPGEFHDIEGTWVTSEGNIAAFDRRNRRITIFDHEGDLRSTSRVVGGEEREDPFANLDAFLGSFEDDDVLLASLQFGTAPGEVATRHDPWILGRFGLDGKLERPLGELRGMRRAASGRCRSAPFHASR